MFGMKHLVLHCIYMIVWYDGHCMEHNLPHAWHIKHLVLHYIHETAWHEHNCMAKTHIGHVVHGMKH